MKLTHRQIATYAFISSNIYGTQDLLFGLLPFFQPILKASAGSAFDIKEFKKRIEEVYGWQITTDVVEDLIPRFEKKGWLTELKYGEKEASYKINDFPDDDYFKKEADKFSKTLEDLGNNFVDFIKRISPLPKVNAEKPNLIDLFLRWLISLEVYEQKLLVQKAKEMLSDNTGSISKNLENESKISKEERYLCARFVTHLEAENKTLFEKIVDINSVVLLTEIAFDFKDSPQKDRKEPDLRVFLDAPFFMDAIGLSGKEREQNALAILKSLKKMECQISIFKHSCDEVRSNLKGLLKNVGWDRYGPTAEALRRSEVREDYVRSVLEDVEYFAEKLGLSVFDRDINLYPYEHKYFTEEDINEFEKHAGWGDSPYFYMEETTPARHRDALSIAFIMRLRAGKNSKDPFKNKAVLITRNKVLEQYAKRFCLEKGSITKSSFGPAIHQRKIASLLWLTYGTSEQKKVSRHQLMIACHKVLALQPRLIKRTQSVLSQIDPKKVPHLHALLMKERSSQVLADITLGTEEVITPDNIEEIYKKVAESTSERIRKEKDREIDYITKAYEKRMEQFKKDIDAKEKQERKMVEGLISKASKMERFIRFMLKGSLFLGIMFEVGLVFKSEGLNFYYLIGLGLATPYFVILTLSKIKGSAKLFDAFLLKIKKIFLIKKLKEIGRLDILERYEIDWRVNKIRKKKK